LSLDQDHLLTLDKLHLVSRYGRCPALWFLAGWCRRPQITGAVDWWLGRGPGVSWCPLGSLPNLLHSDKAPATQESVEDRVVAISWR